MLKPTETEAHNDAMRQLRALNAKFIHNFVTKDVPSHAGITHEGFTSVTSKGARQARPAYLGYWARHSIQR